MGMKTLIDWESLDWTLNDAEIGRLISRSRERVRQKRLELEKSRAASWHKMGGTARERIREEASAGRSSVEIAGVVGCDEDYCLQVLRRDKLPYLVPPDGRREGKYDWGSLGESDWKDKTDKEIAAELGCENPGVVSQWRRRHGVIKNPAKSLAWRRNHPVAVTH